MEPVAAVSRNLNLKQMHPGCPPKRLESHVALRYNHAMVQCEADMESAETRLSIAEEKTLGRRKNPSPTPPPPQMAPDRALKWVFAKGAYNGMPEARNWWNTALPPDIMLLARMLAQMQRSIAAQHEA